MGTVIVLLALVVIVFFALKSLRIHLKGEGDCCGGSKDTFTVKYLNQVLDERKVYIDGIHCQNCEKKIKTAINKVSYLSCNDIEEHKSAIIKGNQIIKDNEIKDIIEKTGYKVNKMEKI